jgi:hypothetical protein
MGLTRYEDAARAAYIGCINANGVQLKDLLVAQGIDLDCIPGLSQAHRALMDALSTPPSQSADATMAKALPPTPLPPLDSILTPIPKTSPRPSRTNLFVNRQRQAPGHQQLDPQVRRNLQSTLVAAIQDRRKAMLDAMPQTQWEKYILAVTSSETAADFLFVPLYQTRNRLFYFKTNARLFLGLPVTADICNIGKCHHKPVATNGNHPHHAQSACTRRHTAIEKALGHALEQLSTSGMSDYSKGFEAPLEHLGFRRLDKPRDKESQHCDIYLKNESTGNILVTDIMVTHPAFEKESNWNQPLAKAKKGARGKIKKFTLNYDIDENDVIPMVFDTYGGYAPSTMCKFKELAAAIGQGDAVLSGRVMRHFRDRIAVNLHNGNANVINMLNSLHTTSGIPRPKVASKT